MSPWSCSGCLLGRPSRSRHFRLNKTRKKIYDRHTNLQPKLEIIKYYNILRHESAQQSAWISSTISTSMTQLSNWHEAAEYESSQQSQQATWSTCQINIGSTISNLTTTTMATWSTSLLHQSTNHRSTSCKHRNTSEWTQQQDKTKTKQWQQSRAEQQDATS